MSFATENCVARLTAAGRYQLSPGRLSRTNPVIDDIWGYRNDSALMSAQDTVIARHKTAIRRRDLSRPVKCAMRDGLIDPGVRVFDYGCGHGEDVQLLRGQGVTCHGWDPVLRPATRQVEADVVNLGYVINVIEDPAERSAALRRAWQLCRRVLVVAAQLKVAGRGKSFVEFGDGIVTGRGTFQKLYEQAELKQYLESELGTEAIPAGLGVFYVFRDEVARQQLLASRYRRRSVAPRQRISEVLFEKHRELLEQFMAAIAELGRVPEGDEFDGSSELIAHFGSLKRAFGVVRRVTGSDEWDTIGQRRTEDLLIYLALARFRNRPPISKLPVGLQRDIRAFFGNYTKACHLADELLFRTGNPDAIDEACRTSSVGKLLPNALYVHRSALDALDPLLRVYEGCGRAYLGEIEGVNVIKLHRFSGKISYLVYPDFETDPHPPLVRCVKLSMRTREIECYDYADSENPPILHRKETFLQPDHPLFSKFARLTRQEEMQGLLHDTATIGTRDTVGNPVFVMLGSSYGGTDSFGKARVTLSLSSKTLLQSGMTPTRGRRTPERVLRAGRLDEKPEPPSLADRHAATAEIDRSLQVRVRP